MKISAKLPGFTRVADDIGFEQGKRAFLFSVGSDAKNVLEAVASSALEDALPKCDEEPTRFAHVDETGVLPHGTSTRRQVLMTALNQLETRNGSPKDEMVDVLTWSEVVIDKALCNSCRMCATFCPTGANFKLEDENGVLGIGHRVRLCANCRLCSDICPTGALSLSEEVFAVDVAGDVIERFEMGKTLERSSTNRDAILEKTRAQLKNDGARVTLA